ILPNKWMKGGYGKALRNYAGKLNTLQMVDFGDLPVFEEATTYPSLWFMTKKNVEVNTFEAAIADTLTYPNGMTAYLKDRWIKVSGESLTDESWNLVDNRLQELMDKIKTAGKPLSEYLNGKIYRGVLTGYNEAFVIDTPTKDRLIQEDPRSAEIIKPFLAGRDIKRYQQPKSEKYLLFTRRGIEIDNYPAVVKQLEQFRSSLEPKPKNWTGTEWPGRKEGTYKWYEIQDAVDYYQDFEMSKIFYQEIASYSTFVYDRKGIYSNNKLFFIPTENMALLGFLNSKLVWFYLNNTANGLRGALALQSPYILALPFTEKLKNHLEISQIVNTVLESKQNNPQENTQTLETQIDQLVYALYELTEEEIAIVEGRG
ncbi:MAG: TaqI-like C-terminal specificity domain-containing protein, partial [Dyadobacter sp.]